MAEYKQALSGKAFQTLTKQSAESLKSMLKGKSFMQASMNAQRLLGAIMRVEAPYQTELEQLAIDTVKEAFPIIEEAGIVLDVKLVQNPGELNMQQSDSEEEPEATHVGAGVDKRRIINGITHGASIRGTKAYYYFKHVLDGMNPELVDRYNEILDDAYGIYDDDNAIAMMLAMLSQNQGNQGGESEADYDEETGVLTIKARALIFPILIHEIIKGLYEIISLQGFSRDAERNQRIANQVDKASNEPEDLRYGKFIYDALNKLVGNSKYYSLDKPSMREYFFIEVYKLPEDEFMDFIDNVVTGDLSTEQLKWVDNTLKNL